MIALPKFTDDKLVEISLVPITLGFGNPPGLRGRPLLASPENASKIIADMIKMSAPFGTKIENRNGVGYVMLSP